MSIEHKKIIKIVSDELTIRFGFEWKNICTR